LAAYVDPVFSTQGYAAHGVFRQVVVEHHQLQLIPRMRVAGSL
jgi:hypothetical protein